MYVMRPRSYSRGLRNRKTYANANFNDNVHSGVRYPSKSFGGWDFAPRSRLESYLKIAPDLPFYRDACSRNAGVGMGRFIAARRGRGEGEKICQLSRSVNTCIRNAADIAVVCISSTSIIIFNKVAALWTPQASAHHNYKFHRRSFSRRKKHVGHRCWLSCSGRARTSKWVQNTNLSLHLGKNRRQTNEQTDKHRVSCDLE